MRGSSRGKDGDGRGWTWWRYFGIRREEGGSIGEGGEERRIVCGYAIVVVVVVVVVGIGSGD